MMAEKYFNKNACRLAHISTKKPMRQALKMIIKQLNYFVYLVIYSLAVLI